MALVTRHDMDTGLSEVPLGTDQNRFDVEGYWDQTLNVKGLSKSVCMFVNADQVFVPGKDYVPLPEDAQGSDGFVIRPRFKTYEDGIWGIVNREVTTKCQELLVNLTGGKNPMDDAQKLRALPWPKRGSQAFQSKFSGQPLYGRASGFMAGPSIVATAAHAIHVYEPGWKPESLKVVFNLRAIRNKTSPNNNNNNNNKTSTSSGGAGGSEWTCVFDRVYDIKNVISYGKPPPKVDNSPVPGSKPPSTNTIAVRLKKSIAEFFAYYNRVGVSYSPSPVYDLALLAVVPATGKTDPAPPPPLTLSEDAPSRTSDPQRTECFVIGGPVGLPLKISGHEPKRTPPRVLRPVEGFYSSFTCDVDIMEANSGGPIFYRDETQKVSVIGIVRQGRVADWGLSSESGDSRPGAPPKTDDVLLTEAREWIKRKIDLAKESERIKDPIKGQPVPSYLLDKAFFTSYAAVTYYEKQKVIDHRRFSERSPVWKEYCMFTRADFIQLVTSSMSSWYRQGRTVSLRVDLTVEVAGTGANIPAIGIQAAMKRRGAGVVQWAKGYPTLSGTPGSGGQSREVKVSWTRDVINGDVTRAFRENELVPISGRYVGDINPDVLAKDSCIANWEKFYVNIANKTGVPEKISIRDATIELKFYDAAMPRALKFRLNLNNFQKVNDPKAGKTYQVFGCDLSNQGRPWYGPTLEVTGAQGAASAQPNTTGNSQLGRVLKDGMFRERATVFLDENGEIYDEDMFDENGLPIPGAFAGMPLDGEQKMTLEEAEFRSVQAYLDGLLVLIDKLEDPALKKTTTEPADTSKKNTPNVSGKQK